MLMAATERANSMFNHPMIQVYVFEDIPIDRDLNMMAEKWMVRYEKALIKSVNEKGPTAYKVGYYAHAAARAIGADSIEMSWYPNVSDRFHEVRIRLPRSAFVTCVGSSEYDYKPLIFVRNEWLDNLYLRGHSVFALVDAINVKTAIARGELARPKLIELRSQIDAIAAANPDVAFISFADSLLLKSNYTIGSYDSPIKNTYQPEKILRLLPNLRDAYRSVLGMEIYVVIAQGSNEYYDDGLLHISASKNHISLNSLGLPFAQIMEFEHQARAAYKDGIHPAADAYLDKTFYNSLRFKHGFDKSKEPRYRYTASMVSGMSYYFPVSFQLLADNLEPLN
jgi:hypothetical protein